MAKINILHIYSQQSLLDTRVSLLLLREFWFFSRIDLLSFDIPTLMIPLNTYG